MSTYLDGAVAAMLRYLDTAPQYAPALLDVVAEIKSARAQHPPMRGAHEGYAVLLEEVDELWAEVKDRRRDLDAMRREAIQIAAMAIAFAAEVCE